MTPTTLRTSRLDLVSCTVELLRAEGDDRGRFAELLEARVPDEWPPDLYDDGARLWSLSRLELTSEVEGWLTYYVVVRSHGSRARELVGVVGYKGPPTMDGTVEVGYSVMEAQRRRGYASEAVAALVARSFEFPHVVRVIADTFPDLTASILVLERNGFTVSGEGSEEGSIRFELARSEDGRASS
jgi:RimJ/RimL family protein N-acetyltransferase